MTLIVAVVLLIADCLQTLDIKNHPNLHEKNKILGKHPSDAKVIIYFSVWILITAACSLLSVELFLLYCLILIVVQSKVIFDNKRLGLRFIPWKK